MELFNKADNKLKELNITCQIIDHPPAVTIELAYKFIEGVEGVRTKTMFLTNKKKRNFFLVVLDDSKRLDMDKFKELVEEKQVKMASPETLMEKMQLIPGIVSPFGLLNNEDKDIKVYIDKEIIGEERTSFHPNTNEKTLFINTPDLLVYLESIGYPANIVEL